MNREITRLAVAGVVLIGSLIVATTYWQTWAAAGLADRQDNAIQRVAQFAIDRGEILGPGGRPVFAENVRRRVGGKTLYFRRYPQRGLAPHIVGYSTQVRSRAGLERSMNDFLTGSNANLSTVISTSRDRLLGGTIHGNDVILTLHPRAQRIALNALGRRCGAVVALEPKSGRVLVLASSPTYDPNLVEGNFGRINRIGAECRPSAALVNRATDGLYAPGSTFKVVTAAAAIDSGRFTVESRFDDPGYCIEYGKRVTNYSDQSGPSVYGNVSLFQALQNSINSVFCNIGKELGPGPILDYSRRFGFYAKPPLETPVNERTASGLYRKGELFTPDDPFAVDPGRLAFGQERLLVTPFQMAMVAAAVANGGAVMRPYVVERVLAPGGKTVTRTKPDLLGRAIKEQTAADLTEMMKAVVASGTATSAQLPDGVAGKTGTAETGRPGVNTVAFIGFAPADNPRVAVAVFVEGQRSTGGQTAAPIAREVMQALLGVGSNS
ncbi:MAG: peptidoglycan D,D-transpeptidase FtsI family protein [Gaiellaceae bacterium]